MGTTLVRAGAIYTLANIASAAVPFLLLPILTRALAPEEYGEVVAFFLLVSVATSTAGLNVHGSIAVRWFERDGIDFPAYVGAAVTVALISMVASAVLLLVVGLFLSKELSLPASMWPLAAVTVGALTIANVRTTLWQSQRKALPAAAFQVCAALLQMGLSLAAVLLLDLGSIGRNGGACLAASLMALAALTLLQRSREIEWVFGTSQLRQVLRFGVPLIPHALAGAIIATADRYAVAEELGANALGIYGAAAQLGMVLNVLSDAVIKTATPWLYTQLSRCGARGRLRVVAVAYASVPVALLAAFVVWGGFLVAGPLLLGSRFQSAVGLSLWFLLGGALTAIYLNIAGLFFFTSRNEWLAVATAISAGIAVLLSPWLTSKLGMEGAAIAYCVVQGVQMLLSWLLSLRVKPMPWFRGALALRILLRRRGAQ